MSSATDRPGGRSPSALRPVNLALGAIKFAEGSALIDMGDTRVLTTATIERRVPPFLIDSGKGWATAEYAMLPRATSRRNARERNTGRLKGRSAEIQRLIGRSLRAALDLGALDGHTLTLDCDVLQADGGTRTAAITGAWCAAVEGLARALLTGDLQRWPIVRQVAGVSVGLVEGRALLDLEAVEDQGADVDLNVVAADDGTLIEVQGTGERTTFTRGQLDELLDLAQQGLAELFEIQRRAVAPILEEVEASRSRRSRRPAAPRDEKDLWGRP